MLLFSTSASRSASGLASGSAWGSAWASASGAATPWPSGDWEGVADEVRHLSASRTHEFASGRTTLGRELHLGRFQAAASSPDALRHRSASRLPMGLIASNWRHRRDARGQAVPGLSSSDAARATRHARAMRFPARHLSYADITATLALFVALGGSSYAAAKLTGRDIKDGTVTGRDVRNGSLGAADFRKGDLPTGPQGLQGAQG